MSFFTLAKPPTSSQVTFGILGAPILSENDSRASFRAVSKSDPDRMTPARTQSASETAELLDYTRVEVEASYNATAAAYEMERVL